MYVPVWVLIVVVVVAFLAFRSFRSVFNSDQEELKALREKLAKASILLYEINCNLREEHNPQNYHYAGLVAAYGDESFSECLEGRQDVFKGFDGVRSANRWDELSNFFEYSTVSEKAFERGFDKGFTQGRVIGTCATLEDLKAGIKPHITLEDRKLWENYKIEMILSD